MKHLLLTLLLAFFATTALADSPEAILKDYRKQAAQAVERLNLSLKNTTTPLITKLVSNGDTAGAELLSSQLKAKLVGEPVDEPHPSVVQIFSLYDGARTKALAPVQKASITRIENLLKSAGAKLEIVTELGKVREMIDGGVVSQPGANLPKVWDYFTGADRQTKQAVLTFNPNRTLTLVSNDQLRTELGKWSVTRDPKVLKVTLETNRGEEKCLFKINGEDAELERPVGVRYLRVQQ